MNRTLTVQINAQTSGLQQGVNTSIARLRQLASVGNQAGNQLSGGFSSPLGSLSKLAGGLAFVATAVAALKQGLQITSDIERLDAALKAVSSSSSDFGRTQNFLRSASDQLGISYEVLAGTYKGLKAAANGTVLEGEATEKIFMSVVRAGAALKLSNDDIQGTLLALQQMMSKGTVQAEELRGQLGERLPGAFKLMAKGLGVTEVALNKMLEQGQVLAVDALPKLAIELEKTYGDKAQANVNTLAGGFTRATDQVRLFTAEFFKTNGIDTFFSKLGNGIANYIKGLREAQRRGESVFGLSKERRVTLADQATEREKFSVMKPGERVDRIAQLQVQRDDYKNKADNPKAFNMSEGVAAANRRAQLDTEEKLRILKRENLKLVVAEREESAKAAKLPKAAVAGFDIDKAKDRQAALAKQIQNIIGGGGTVPTALRSEYNKLTAQIDRATESTKKLSKQKVAPESIFGNAVQEAAKELQNLQGRIDNFNYLGITPPIELSAKLAKLTEDFRRMAEASATASAARTPLKRTGGAGALSDNLASEGDRQQRLIAPIQTPALPNLDKFQAGIAEPLDRAKQRLLQFNDDVSNALTQAAGSALVGMGDVIGGLLAGTEGIEALPQMLLSVLGGMMVQLGQIAIGAGLAVEAIKTALTSLGGIGAIAAGVALVALGKVVGSSVAKVGNARPMASGGILSGPQHILAGEYAGAASNPEVVAPLSKLKGMINDNQGGDGTLRVNVTGEQLQLVLDRYNRNKRLA